MNRRTKLALLLLAALAAAAMVWMQYQPSRTPATSPWTNEASGPEIVVADSPTPPGNISNHGPVRAALPPPNAPLATILAPLVERADAGDARAACRLAMELIRCDFLRTSMVFLADPKFELDLEARGKLDTADQVALGNLARIEHLQECRVVPGELQDRAGHYLSQAARAGVPEAMVRYAEGHYWPADGRGVFSDPAFDQWRQEAPAILQRAFEAGVPEATASLMTAYQWDTFGVGALIPKDPVKAEAMRMLLVRLQIWSDFLVPSSMDAASLAEATRLAEQWHQGPFKGRSFRGHRLFNFVPPDATHHDGQPLNFCTDTAPKP